MNNKAVLYEGNDLQVIAKIREVDPKLATKIEQVEQGNRGHFVEIAYKFGDLIIDEYGRWQLPIDDKIKKMVEGECKQPVFLLLSGAAELFFDNVISSIPMKILFPGDVFGLEALIDHQNRLPVPHQTLQLSSGARSLFMLPKIGDQLAHQRLCEHFNTDIATPRRLVDQWRVFKSLCQNNAKITTDAWETRVLFFCQDWFDSEPNQVDHYLLDLAWKISWRCRQHQNLEVLFNQLEAATPLSVKTEIRIYCRRLILEAVGLLPGMIHAKNDSCAPISLLQKIYGQFYVARSNNIKVTDKALAVMTAGYLEPKENKKQLLFSSFQYPTYFDAERRDRRVNRLEDIRDTKQLLERYMNLIRELPEARRDKLIP